MKLNPNEIRIDCTPNDSIGGMKVGTPPIWLTITHTPSMQCVRILQSDGESQHKCRNRAIALMELMLDDYETPRVIHKERLETKKFLIQKYGGYYRPNSSGYTSSAIIAGRYSEEEAENITHPNGPNGPRDGMTYIHEDDVKDEDWIAVKHLIKERFND